MRKFFYFCFILFINFWLSVCYDSDQLISIHYWISGVLALGMLETTVTFAHYLHWNDVGRPAISVAMTSLILGTSKRAISRIVVQLVSLGYGVVRPSVGEDMNRVLILGSSYLFLSLLYGFSTTSSTSNKVVDNSSAQLLTLIVLLLAAIDTTFYVWTLSSISNLLITLAARKQATKYLLYRNFRTVLLTSVFFTCVWAIYGSIFVYDTSYDSSSNWEYKWTIDALWEITYFCVFVAIAFLWAPSSNSQKYAYSIELSQLDHDEEYNPTNKLLNHSNEEDGLDHEYGGKLQDDNDPFIGTGALDTVAAIGKKN